MTQAQASSPERIIHKKPLLDSLHTKDEPALKKYQDFFVGSRSVSKLLMFELAAMVIGPMPGAAGFFLRKLLFPRLFKSVGSGVNWGRGITMRHPGNIEIGSGVAIDDGCLLDAKGAGEAGIKIGNQVLIARDTIVQGKGSFIEIGDRCTIGSQCQLSSAGGIKLGQAVMIAGQCYLGGGRYRTEDRTKFILDQELYSKGPVVIEDDVWLGAGVIVQDGVRIGRGSVIGAGAVVREDVPEYTVVTPHARMVMLPRGEA